MLFCDYPELINQYCFRLKKKMSQNHPKISLGMPVFDGQNYIEPAIRSILAQTYSDFELIISDNASNDRTEEICRDYARKDKRIRYFRNEKNLGLARKF